MSYPSPATPGPDQSPPTPANPTRQRYNMSLPVPKLPGPPK